ncbi:MAG: SpoIIE family protein phosphatase [Bryobacteraceae bacterium]
MKELRIPAALAVAGALLLCLLFPRLDPSVKFSNKLDRREAIRQARQISAKYGVDANLWRARINIKADDKLRAFLSAYPKDPAGKLFAPVSWLVLLQAPDGKRSVAVNLFADGRPALWRLRSGRSDASPPPAAAPTIAWRDFAGQDAAHFSVAQPAETAPSGYENQAWEWRPAKSSPLIARLETLTRNGRLTAVGLKPAYQEDFERYYKQSRYSVVRGVVAFLHFLTFCLALILLMLAWSRRRFTWRAPAIWVAVALVWGALGVWNAPDFRPIAENLNAVDAGIAPEDQSNYNIGLVAGYFGDDFMPILSFFVFGAAAYCRVSSSTQRKWLSIEALGHGGILTQQACRPIAAGALCGIAAAAVPYLIAWLPPFRAAGFDFRSITALAAPTPGLILPSLQKALPAIGFFAFVYPLARGLRAKWLGITFLSVAAAAFTISSGEVFDSLPPALIAGAILVILYFELYRRFDILAAVTAMLAAHAVLLPALLLTQPLGSFREAGLQALVLLVVGMVAFVNLAVRGRVSAIEAGPEIPDYVASGQSSKERLEAEFQVARRAQQDALPAAPPALEGFSFAAACEPAKQVGGDLYDFFTLPDGRLGIAVADVSGKGVPAALYMMVTKGLLAAATRDSSDLTGILENINALLYRACKRKVFVTMAAIAIDPARRRFQYGRAGHNPIVWRRANRGETLLLQSRGIGLGMSGHEMFARHLRIEEFDLEAGDAVVLYSDGITEAENAAQEQFGEDRLMRAVEAADGQSALDTRDGLLKSLEVFTSGTPAHDDVTVVVVRVAA